MISQEEIQDFRHEVIDEIEKMDSVIFNSLNDSPDEVKKSMLRLLHNTKGTSGMFELSELETFCHDVETSLEKITITKEHEDSLLQVTQVLESYMNHLDPLVFQTKITFLESQEIEESPTEEITDDRKSAEYVEVMKFSLNELIAQKEKEFEEKTSYGHTPSIKTKLKYALIEDEELLSRSVSNIFKDLSISIDTFESADAFLEKANPDNYHLIITDKNLPGTDGISLIKEVKKSHPLVPIILISGFLNEDALINASQLGIAGVLPKPFKTQLLIRQSYNASLNFLNRVLLEKALQTINYTFGAIEFNSKLSEDEIKELKAEIQTINLEMIKIKKYFATISKD